MLPPGRRRDGAQSLRPFLLALFFLFFASTAHAAGSVLGIDFGTQHIKAVLVKPGIPLEIVLTKDSKRKESAAVAFKVNKDVPPEAGVFPERLYGGDALALQGRLPGEVFPNLKPLLGSVAENSESKYAERAIRDYRERYPAIRLEPAEALGTTVIRSSAFVSNESAWSVEELLAMELASIRHNAENMAGKGSSVDDAVITVPPFYTADEKRSIERAAILAGFNVNALISDGLAVGMDYAKSRTFPEVTKGEKPEHHIVFDMGAGSTSATLLRFQSRTVKDVGRFNKTVQEVAVLGTGWDRTLGGDSLTNLVVDDYINKLLTKPVLKSRGVGIDDIRSNGRAMSRLWKEADKARQVLSANTETSSSFEELLPDVDFRVKISRTDFDDLATEYTERVAQPIADALAAAQLEMVDIDSIILHGGAVRTPFVQKALERAAGGSAKLRSNVNSDESAVFGAAFKGASLSPSFKVKEIRDSDVPGYPAGMSYTDGGKQRRQILFSALSPVGSGASTKQVTFKDKEDFSFGLYQVIDGMERLMYTLDTSNLTASVKQLKSSFGCDKEDITTKFSIRLSPEYGVPDIQGGTVSCEVEGDGKSESIGDSVKDWLGFGKKKDQESLKDGEGEESGPTEEVEAASSVTSEAASDTTSSSAKSTGSKAPAKPKKRTESVPIEFSLTPKGNSQPPQAELERMWERLAAFDQSDRARVAREEALNVLESYSYYVRDFLTNDDYAEVSTSTQRDEINQLLASTREFLENVRDATKDTLTEKYTALRAMVDPVLARRNENTLRPAKVTKLYENLAKTEKLIEMLQEQVEQAETAQRKAAEWDASQSASATATESSTAAEEVQSSAAVTPSTSVDELADLEEPNAETQTPAADPVPKYDNAADFSPYAEVDFSKIIQARSSILEWLDEQTAAQDKLQPHEEPVLRVKDVEKKAEELGKIMRNVLDKKKEFSAKEAAANDKAKKKTKSQKAKATSSSSSSSSTSTEETATSATVNPDEAAPTEEIPEQKSSTHIPDEL